MSIAITSQLDVAKPHFTKVGISPRKITWESSKPAAWKEEGGRRKSEIRGIRAQPIWMRHRPRVTKVPGAMVDIGLGPTFGFSDFVGITYETITSSRPD